MANWTSCYQIVTPVGGHAQRTDLTPASALQMCERLDPRAHLVSVDSIDEQQQLLSLLRNEPS